jgi:hypothetical protein
MLFSRLAARHGNKLLGIPALNDGCDRGFILSAMNGSKRLYFTRIMMADPTWAADVHVLQRDPY